MKLKTREILIWSLIFADLLSGLLLILQVPFARVGLVFKALIIFFLFYKYLTKLNQKSFQSIYLTMALLTGFWLVGFISSFFINPYFDYADSIVVLNRYLFFMILLCAFMDWSSDEHFEFEAGRIFEWFLMINNAFIFIGFIFKLDILSTYDPYNDFGDLQRFGYKGLIYGQNAVAGIYALGQAYLFREHFKYKRNKIWHIAFICLASVMLGTKASLFTLVLIGGYYMVKYRFKTTLLLGIPAVIGMFFVIIANWQYIVDNYLLFLIDKYNSMDFYTFWTSNRNGLLNKALMYIDQRWTLVNFLFGDASSYVEMDFIDLYFFFGVSGLIYVIIYVKAFFMRDRSADNYYVFLVLMMMAFVAGHIINSAIVPPFYLLFIFSGSLTSSRVPSSGLTLA